MAPSPSAVDDTTGGAVDDTARDTDRAAKRAQRKVARRNVTLSLPEELVRQARVLAAEQDRSLTSLVEQQLEQILKRQMEYDRLWEKVFRDTEKDSGMRIGERTWTRDDLHDRSL